MTKTLINYSLTEEDVIALLEHQPLADMPTKETLLRGMLHEDLISFIQAHPKYLYILVKGMDFYSRVIACDLFTLHRDHKTILLNDEHPEVLKALVLKQELSETSISKLLTRGHLDPIVKDAIRAKEEIKAYQKSKLDAIPDRAMLRSEGWLELLKTLPMYEVINGVETFLEWSYKPNTRRLERYDLRPEGSEFSKAIAQYPYLEGMYYLRAFINKGIMLGPLYPIIDMTLSSPEFFILCTKKKWTHDDIIRIRKNMTPHRLKSVADKVPSAIDRLAEVLRLKAYGVRTFDESFVRGEIDYYKCADMIPLLQKPEEVLDWEADKKLGIYDVEPLAWKTQMEVYLENSDALEQIEQALLDKELVERCFSDQEKRACKSKS